MRKSPIQCGRDGMYDKKQHLVPTFVCHKQPLKLINAMPNFQTHQHGAPISKILMLTHKFNKKFKFKTWLTVI